MNSNILLITLKSLQNTRNNLIELCKDAPSDVQKSLIEVINYISLKIIELEHDKYTPRVISDAIPKTLIKMLHT